jgi:hypothetical protein
LATIDKNQFYKLLVVAMLMSLRVFANDVVLCKSFYLNPVSIEFGKLFQEANDLHTLEALNEHSKNLIFALAEPDPLDHLINTLLFYRGLARILPAEELEHQFGQKDYRFLYRFIKTETHTTNEKFNYFRKNLLDRVIPDHYSELVPH